MTHKFLDMAGVKSEKEFYKKFPTQEAFFKKYPKAAEGLNLPPVKFTGEDPGMIPPWMAQENVKFTGEDPGMNPGFQQEPLIDNSARQFLPTPKVDPITEQYNSDPKFKKAYDKSIKKYERSQNKTNLGNVALGGLLAVDAILPGQKPRNNYALPQDELSTNKFQYGRPSSALMKEGGTIKRMADGGTKPKPKPKLNTAQLSDFGNFSGDAMGNMLSYNKKLQEYGLKNSGNLMDPYKATLSGDVIKNSQQDWVSATTSRAIANARRLNIAPEAFEANAEVIFGNDRYSNAIFKDKDFSRMYPNYMQVASKIYKDRYDNYTPQVDGIAKMEDGGTVDVGNGLVTEKGKIKPLSFDTMMFVGASHEKGGIQGHYGGKRFEAEGGEPVIVDENGMTVFGRLKNPLTGNQFKKDAKFLAKKELDTQKIMDQAMQILDEANPEDKHKRYAFNGASVMLKMGAMKKGELASSKRHLTDLQKIETSESQYMRDGGFIPKFATGGTVDNPPKKITKQTLPDGTIIITYTDGITHTLYKNGRLKETSPDGTFNMFDISPDTVVDIKSDRQGNQVLIQKDGASYTQFSNNRIGKKTPDGKVKMYTGDINTLQIEPDPEPRSSKKKDEITPVTTSGSGWEWKGTKKDKLDAKILKFIDMAAAKGFTGFSNEKGGYDKRNTSSGRRSRHETNQALDAAFKDPEIYKKIMEDKELATYLYENGLTMVNEYDPEIQKQTQKGNKSPFPHLHVGYDKGTPISDKFRREYEAKYKPTKKPNLVNITANNKAIPGAPSGDGVSPAIEKATPIPEYGGLKRAPLGETPVVTPVGVEGNPDPVLKNPAPWTKGTDAEGLGFEQVLPELVSMASNKVEPVLMQKYNPELYDQYQISLQDRRNMGNAQFNATRKALAYDPTALAALEGQQAEFQNTINAEEFRLNQGLFNDIENKNVALLNDTKARNLALTDQQYVRQSQAKSNTKAQMYKDLGSIASKIQQNKLEQATLKVYENMYNHYQYDPNMRIQKVGPSGDAYTSVDNPLNMFPVKKVVTSTQGNVKIQEVYNPSDTYGFGMPKLKPIFGVKPVSLVKRANEAK